VQKRCIPQTPRAFLHSSNIHPHGQIYSHEPIVFRFMSTRKNLLFTPGERKILGYLPKICQSFKKVTSPAVLGQPSFSTWVLNNCVWQDWGVNIPSWVTVLDLFNYSLRLETQLNEIKRKPKTACVWPKDEQTRSSGSTHNFKFPWTRNKIYTEKIFAYDCRLIRWWLSATIGENFTVKGES